MNSRLAFCMGCGTPERDVCRDWAFFIPVLHHTWDDFTQEHPGRFMQDNTKSREFFLMIYFAFY